jgi:hypothetical protein
VETQPAPQSECEHADGDCIRRTDTAATAHAATELMPLTNVVATNAGAPRACTWARQAGRMQVRLSCWLVAGHSTPTSRVLFCRAPPTERTRLCCTRQKQAAGTGTHTLASTGATLAALFAPWTRDASFPTLPPTGGHGRALTWTGAAAATASRLAHPGASARFNIRGP